jgi:hypothetical protein
MVLSLKKNGAKQMRYANGGGINAKREEGDEDEAEERG